MSGRSLKLLLLSSFVVMLVAGLPAAAQARAAYSVGKPKLSAAPVVDVPFTVSGAVRPKATVESRTMVKIKLYTLTDGHWGVTGTYRAKLGTSASGTAYSRRLAVLAEGKYAVRAFHYRAGKLVAQSARISFDVAQRVTVDSNVNGWMAPQLGDTPAPAGTPLDVVFTTPADWTSGASEKVNGAAHFIWGDFVKVDADGLIWHTDGLQPGRYDWMRDSGPKWGTGALVVAQHIAISSSWLFHDDTHALPYLPTDVSFGDVSPDGCDRSIAFLTRIFTQTSADPLVWHTDGLVPGSYDWKCWMDDCHYGKLVVDDAVDVNIDADVKDSQTVVAANTPVDLVFSGAMMMCWRTIHFTTAGDFTKTRAYPDPLTWHSEGLAPGSYEWECWMGPECHHGTVVVQ